MKALSIRQPWAWLILNAGKDVENRTWVSHLRCRILVHASKTMTRADYEACALFCSGLPHEIKFPRFEELELGGIVGEVDVIGCVAESQSPWFVGPYAFVLRNPAVLPFRPLKGQLGFFDV